jgi:hypothetical protein
MSDLTIAKTILDQLGGKRFLVMTGAKQLVGSPASLSMRLNSVNEERKRVNYVAITLDPSDTYTLVAGYVRGTTFTEVFKRDDVYCDQIQEIFTKATGLYTHL